MRLDVLQPTTTTTSRRLRHGRYLYRRLPVLWRVRTELRKCCSGREHCMSPVVHRDRRGVRVDPLNAALTNRGGGSKLTYKNGMFVVGPDSVGAQ